MIVAGRSDAIAHANFDRLQRVQTVNVGDRQFINAVNHRRLARGYRVEPSTAPRAAGGCAELASHGVQQVGDLCAFAGQRAFADAGGVRLHHAHHAVHAMRWHAGAGTGAARRRVGGRDKRIRAVIDVEESALCAFKQNIFLLLHGFMQQHHGVGDKGLQPIARCAIRCVNFLKRERFRPECFENFIVLFDLLAKQRLEPR